MLTASWAEPAHEAPFLLWGGSQHTTRQAACWAWLRGERWPAARKAPVPGCERQRQHLLANTIHVQHQRQLVLPHRVGTQGDLVEEKSSVKYFSTPRSHQPRTRGVLHFSFHAKERERFALVLLLLHVWTTAFPRNKTLLTNPTCEIHLAHQGTCKLNQSTTHGLLTTVLRDQFFIATTIAGTQGRSVDFPRMSSALQWEAEGKTWPSKSCAVCSWLLELSQPPLQ